jgi:hypothetical protein
MKNAVTSKLIQTNEMRYVDCCGGTSRVWSTDRDQREEMEDALEKGRKNVGVIN